MVLTKAPAACPYCALMLLVRTVNSATDSSGGVILREPSLKLSLLSAPFSVVNVPDSRTPPAAALRFIPWVTVGAAKANCETSRLISGMLSMKF